MKQYTILADSLTGIKGKQLLKGKTYPEGEINGKHIDDLVKQGFIKEYVKSDEKSDEKTEEHAPEEHIEEEEHPEEEDHSEHES